MQYEITEKALQDLEDLENFLLRRWNQEIVFNFYEKFEKILENIASGKVIYQQHEKENFQKVLITKHNTLMFMKTDEKIIVIRIINNFRSEENKRL